MHAAGRRVLKGLQPGHALRCRPAKGRAALRPDGCHPRRGRHASAAAAQPPRRILACGAVASSPGRRGKPDSRDKVRRRVLLRVVQRANEKIAGDGGEPLPEGLSPHALRRSFASWLVAEGEDPAYVMAQLGHTDPTMTLGLYAKAAERLRTRPRRAARWLWGGSRRATWRRRGSPRRPAQRLEGPPRRPAQRLEVKGPPRRPRRPA